MHSSGANLERDEPETTAPLDFDVKPIPASEARIPGEGDPETEDPTGELALDGKGSDLVDQKFTHPEATLALDGKGETQPTLDGKGEVELVPDIAVDPGGPYDEVVLDGKGGDVLDRKRPGKEEGFDSPIDMKLSTGPDLDNKGMDPDPVDYGTELDMKLTSTDMDPDPVLRETRDPEELDFKVERKHPDAEQLIDYVSAL